MRPLRLVLLSIVTVVGLLLAVVGIAYATDYAVEATVEDKQCGGVLGGNAVTIQTKLFGIVHTVTGLPQQQCLAVNAGNFVQYHLRSGRTSIYHSEGGACIFDSEGGVGGCGN